MTELSDYNQNSRNTPPEYQVSLPSVNTFTDQVQLHRSNPTGLNENNYPVGFNLQVAIL